MDIRSDGIYNIDDYDKEIEELDPDILNELIKYKNNDSPSILSTITTDDINDDDLNIEIDVKRGYNISEKELYKTLLDLPNDYVDDYGLWSEMTYLLKKKSNWGEVWNRWSSEFWSPITVLVTGHSVTGHRSRNRARSVR